MSAMEMLEFTSEKILEGLPIDSSHKITDVNLCQWIVDRSFGGEVVYSNGLGWQRWVGTHWEDASPQFVRGKVSDFLKTVEAILRLGGADLTALSAIRSKMSAARVKSLMGQLESEAYVEEGFFTPPAELLNVRNGVVNLRTGELGPHDSSWGFRQVTRGCYVPGLIHRDWEMALTALSPDMAVWLQLAVGQGATGVSPLDDRANFLIGERAGNGKSTLVLALDKALGDFAKLASERVLLGGVNDHPTERMQLFGARMVFVEELPQRMISAKMLKDITGRKMVARKIRQDNVEWEATHTLFITSNHPVEIDSLDNGARRRVRIFPFEKEFVAKPTKPHQVQRDLQLRERLTLGYEGQHDAVVTWAVSGSIAWFANNCEMPPEPAEAQLARAAWEESSDLLANFFNENLEPSKDSYVAIVELLDALNAFLRARGHAPWREAQLRSAFRSHPVLCEYIGGDKRTRVVEGRSMPSHAGFIASGARQMMCWWGIKFR